MNILLAEDDPAIAESLRKNFTSEGHAATIAADGESAILRAGETVFDVIILDWKMPGKSGIEVCRILRQRGVLSPVILLTVLAEVDRKVEALDAGADDFVTKPFSFRELLARVRAVHRRHDSSAMAIPFDHLKLNLVSRSIEGPEGGVKLTEREFDLLRHFLNHRGILQSKEALCTSVWKMPFDPSTNVIDVTVRNLRKRLAEVTDHSYIRSSYGEGYVFVAE